MNKSRYFFVVLVLFFLQLPVMGKTINMDLTKEVWYSKLRFTPQDIHVMEDKLFPMVKKRQNMPEYKDRRVTVSSLILPHQCKKRIADEGNGFDHHARRKQDFHKLNEDGIGHGRAIIMTTGIFD